MREGGAVIVVVVAAVDQPEREARENYGFGAVCLAHTYRIPFPILG
jgi:hypothetical protein